MADAASRAAVGSDEFALGAGAKTYIDEGAAEDGEPVGGDVARGEEAAEENDAGEGEAEGVEGGRAVELEELDCCREGPGDQGCDGEV